MFNWLKGGKKDMARDLVDESKRKDKVPSAPTQAPSTEQVKVITFEQLIANHLETIIINQESMHRMMMEGFKQVGVKFE